MTATERAIEDAIREGFRKTDLPVLENSVVSNEVWIRFEREIEQRHIPTLRESDILLCSDFWQALGRARGWDARKEKLDNKFNEIRNGRYYQDRLLDFLDAGKSIEEFFISLEG